jgi:hypothetical protein
MQISGRLLRSTLTLFTRSWYSAAFSIQAEEMAEASVRNSAREDEIRRRAYEIYLECGAEPGREMDDWLQAERELERRALRQAQAG